MGVPDGGQGHSPEFEAQFRNRNSLLGGTALRLRISEEQGSSVLFPSEKAFQLRRKVFTITLCGTELPHSGGWCESK